MDILQNVFITSQDPFCVERFDIDTFEQLREFDVDDYAEEFGVYSPSSHEIYLNFNTGHECVAICDTFVEIQTQINRLVERIEKDEMNIFYESAFINSYDI